MTSLNSSDNDSQANQTLRHTDILDQVGSGKSMFLAPVIIDAILNITQQPQN